MIRRNILSILPLPYPVRESDSHARFDKKQRKLLVTLAVIKEIPSDY